MVFVWDELGGPSVSAPQRRGFGTKLMMALATDMGGTATADFGTLGCTSSLARGSGL